MDRKTWWTEDGQTDRTANRQTDRIMCNTNNKGILSTVNWSDLAKNSSIKGKNNHCYHLVNILFPVTIRRSSYTRAVLNASSIWKRHFKVGWCFDRLSINKCFWSGASDFCTQSLLFICSLPLNPRRRRRRRETYYGAVYGMQVVGNRLPCPGHRAPEWRKLHHTHYCANIWNTEPRLIQNQRKRWCENPNFDSYRSSFCCWF